MVLWGKRINYAGNVEWWKGKAGCRKAGCEEKRMKGRNKQGRRDRRMTRCQGRGTKQTRKFELCGMRRSPAGEGEG
jgi:hypothetical protein